MHVKDGLDCAAAMWWGPDVAIYSRLGHDERDAFSTSMLPTQWYTMKKSEIKFNVTLDDKNLPQNIEWSATEGDVSKSSRAIMLSVWDTEANNSLRIDLWTQEMMVDEMKMFFYQTLLSMADTLERATGEKEASKEMRIFSHEFGKRMKIIKKAVTLEKG